MPVLHKLLAAALLIAGGDVGASTEPPAQDKPTMAADIQAGSARWATAEAGWLRLDLDRTTLRHWGLRTEDLGATQSVPLWPEGRVRVALGDGAPTAWQGRMRVPGLVWTRTDGARSPHLRMRPSGSGLEAELVDAEGDVWARMQALMRSPERDDGWRVITGNLLVGPALARWLARDIDGAALANVTLQVPLRSAGVAKTCADPVWPGTPGRFTDVLLTSLSSTLQQRCRQSGNPAAACDGPGGDPGQVIVASNVVLANSADPLASDVPWFQQFTAAQPPYGNDQHPFLVWNLYRQDADGNLAQVARSALKHAFATANTNCADTTCTGTGFSQILGRGCSDLYNLGSQDCARFLAPRDEVWPSRGIWGRCGSLFDADCDGLPDARVSGAFCSGTVGSPALNGYGLRMQVDERDIDPAEHPGARWFIDAWYVVRDDADLFNTMGWREITPQYQVSGSRWTFSEGSYHVGAVLADWAAADAADMRRYSRLDTAEGQIAVASRVRQMGPESWRYDYVVMNFSLTRPVTEQAEPNLRILRNLGVDGIRVPRLDAGLMAQDFAFDDGDRDAGNDWALSEQADAWRWDAPASGHLPWGSMLRVSLTSTKPPAIAAVQLDMAEAGSPATYAADAWVPDPFVLLRDGFEN